MHYTDKIIHRHPLMDVNVYRFHAERPKCSGLFMYNSGITWINGALVADSICPGCGGLEQDSFVDRARRRLRLWIMKP